MGISVYKNTVISLQKTTSQNQTADNIAGQGLSSSEHNTRVGYCRLAAKHAVPAQSPSELRCETSRLMSALMECRVHHAAGSQVATVGTA